MEGNSISGAYSMGSEVEGTSSPSTTNESKIIGHPGRFRTKKMHAKLEGTLKNQDLGAGSSGQQLPGNQEQDTGRQCQRMQDMAVEEITSTALHPLIANCNDFYITQADQDETTKQGCVSSERVNQVANPVINHTLASTGSGRVLLVKIKDVNAKEIINNPIKIAQCITDSPFDNPAIKDIRIDKKQGFIIIELKEDNLELLRELLKVKVLGTLNVECAIPYAELCSYGVVSPVSTDASLEELQALMKIDRLGSTQIIKCERLNKKLSGKWVPSSVIKITFTGKRLPKAVKIAHSYYPIRPYVNEPIMCYNCQRLGHRSINCKAKMRCLLCGGSHNKSECEATEHKCVHCGGPHTANSKNCQIIKEARKIESIRAHQNITYIEAREQVIQEKSNHQHQAYRVDQYQNYNSNRNTDYSIESSEKEDEVIRTYSKVLRSSRPKAMPLERNYQSRGTQTENRPFECTSNNTWEIPTANAEFLDKIKLCILEVLKAHILSESASKQGMMIDSALKSHFEVSASAQVDSRGELLPEEGTIMQNVEKETEGQRKRSKHSLSEDDDDVLSHNNDSEDESVFQTVEKKQIRVSKTRKSKAKKKKQ